MAVKAQTQTSHKSAVTARSSFWTLVTEDPPKINNSSDYKNIADKFPNSSIHTIKNAGHWVHAEAPEEFYQTVVNFID